MESAVDAQVKNRQHLQNKEDKSTNKYRRYPPYTVFSSLYDAAMGEAVLPSIIDVFERAVKKHSLRIGSVADVGCGTGRFLQYLSRSHSILFGIDNSPTMLRRAADNTSGIDVIFLKQNLKQLQLPEKVDCITCTFDTINYLHNRSDLKQAFAAFASNLKPGGALMFDYIPAGAHKRQAGMVRQFVRWRSMSSEWRIEIDPQGRGSRVTILIRRKRRDGGTDRGYEVHEQRWHAEDEVNGALQDAGFKILQLSNVEPDGNGQWLHVAAQLAPTSPD